MILISAMTKERVIGSGDGMPWNIPEEFSQFQAYIRGEITIAGRRSWDIFGPDLTSAHNIVVSRSSKQISGATVCISIDEARKTADALEGKVFCIGGASIYKLCLPFATEMYLSFIKGDYSGDAYFPRFDEAAWDIVAREDHARFEFIKYRRKSV